LKGWGHERRWFRNVEDARVIRQAVTDGLGSGASSSRTFVEWYRGQPYFLRMYVYPTLIGMVIILPIGACNGMLEDGANAGKYDYEQNLRGGTQKLGTGEAMTDEEADAVGDFLEWQNEQDGK
jgi:hypothetical protein